MRREWPVGAKSHCSLGEKLTPRGSELVLIVKDTLLLFLTETLISIYFALLCDPTQQLCNTSDLLLFEDTVLNSFYIFGR